MGSRIAVASMLALLATVPASGAPLLMSGAERVARGPLRPVTVDEVRALVPERWEYRAMPAGQLRGLQASRDLEGRPPDLGTPGLEAFWVDATGVRVPSDYYVMAARGPATDRLTEDPDCRPERHRVLAGPGHRDGYLATATGTCSSTRWAAVVAAPSFGPARAVGIPQSGLYIVRVSVREGPAAGQRLGRLLDGIAFGDATLGDLVGAAGGPPRLV